LETIFSGSAMVKPWFHATYPVYRPTVTDSVFYDLRIQVTHEGDSEHLTSDLAGVWVSNFTSG